MTWTGFYFLCFALGSLWAIATVLMGGLHVGHSHAPHSHFGHGHMGQGARGHADANRFGNVIHPSVIAVFLAWFGGIGYLLTRYTGWRLWLNAVFSAAAGVCGAAIIGAFLSFLNAREKPLDSADYAIVGLLGKVSQPIRASGVGEILYIQEGSRRSLAACSDEGISIGRGQEVIVVRYERGIAYVRSWDAMTQ